MKVTNTMLRKAHACEHQRDIFKAQWPRGCEVTRENLEKALEIRLDLSWFPKMTDNPYGRLYAALDEAAEQFYADVRPAAEVRDAARREAYRLDETAKLEATNAAWDTYNEAIGPFLAKRDAAHIEAILAYVAEEEANG